MDYSKIQLFSMLQQKMAYHSERQDVLSQNVANADTPGFKPSDLPALDFSDQLARRSRLQMARSAPSHSEGTTFRLPTYRVQEERTPFEVKPDENAVNVEQQMAEISHNAFEFQTSTTLYRKTAGLFKIAIGANQ